MSRRITMQFSSSSNIDGIAGSVWQSMKKYLCVSAVLLAFVLGGCAESLNNISESVKDKNIAAGSDTTGGNIELASKAENAWIPNIELWFGHRRIWYVSLKKDADVSQIPAIVKAGSQEMSLKAGSDGVGVTQGE